MGRGHGRRYDPRLVAVASLCGIAERYAQSGRISHDEALAQIAATTGDRSVITQAAAFYVRSAAGEAWRGRAAELLRAAGADI